MNKVLEVVTFLRIVSNIMIEFFELEPLKMNAVFKAATFLRTVSNIIITFNVQPLIKSKNL